jgi:hypothetical protein
MSEVVEIQPSSHAKEQSVQDELLRTAMRLIENGYEPVPVFASDKRPLIRGWQCPKGEEVTIERFCGQLLGHPDHKSIGLLTRRLPSVDLDIWDEDEASFLREAVEAHLGPTPLRRRGQKGMMLSYRLDGEPRAKIVIAGRKPDWEKPKTLVEIFGTGGQFVAFGIHPATQKPYQWLEKSPLTVPWSDLPPVRAAQLLDLKGDLVTVLEALGYVVNSAVEKIQPAGTPPVVSARFDDTAEITSKFLDLARYGISRARQSGYLDLRCCPGCGHNDYKAGIRVVAGGGFVFHCHHANCEWNQTTGWQPGRPLGKRERKLYAQLGGNPDDLPVYGPPPSCLKGYSSIDEMKKDFGIKK